MVLPITLSDYAATGYTIPDSSPAFESLAIFDPGFITGLDSITQSLTIVLQATPDSVPGVSFGVGVSQYLDTPTLPGGFLDIITDRLNRVVSPIEVSLDESTIGGEVVVVVGYRKDGIRIKL